MGNWETLGGCQRSVKGSLWSQETFFNKGLRVERSEVVTSFSCFTRQGFILSLCVSFFPRCMVSIGREGEERTGIEKW